MDLRGFRPEDAAEVTGCIAQLQNYERTIDERWLRIGVLGRNEVARGLYERCGFEDRLVLQEKPLSGT